MRTLAILTLIALAAPHAVNLSAQSTQSWTQWGGPTRNFIVNSTGLAEKWPETGPPVIWSRPLGTGHSAILVDDVSRRQRPRQAGPMGGRGNSDRDGCGHRQDAVGAQVSVAPRRLQLWRRSAFNAADRRRSLVHHRHAEADVRVRQEERQGAVVARFREGFQLS